MEERAGLDARTAHLGEDIILPVVRRGDGAETGEHRGVDGRHHGRNRSRERRVGNGGRLGLLWPFWPHEFRSLRFGFDRGPDRLSARRDGAIGVRRRRARGEDQHQRGEHDRWEEEGGHRRVL